MTEEKADVMAKLIKGEVRALLDIAQTVHPIDFQTLIVATMACVFGGLPKDYWDKLTDCKPCDVEGCNCHVLAKDFFVAAKVLREDYIKTMNKRSKHN
jgi:hypothetical protein